MGVLSHLSLAVLILFIIACKQHNTLSTNNNLSNTVDTLQANKPTIIDNASFLIKDSTLSKLITIDQDFISYTHDDSTYRVYLSDSLQWLNTYSTPTPSLSFWNINKDSSITTPNLKNTKDSILPLKGLKIALDPGHLAGTKEMAEIESKLININHPDKIDPIFFYEGELNFLTVSLLKDSLEKLGAQTFVTRDKNKSAFGYTYFHWLNNYFQHDLDSCFSSNIITEEDYETLKAYKGKPTLLAKKVIFHKFFKHLDFYQRAKIINEFQPDLTVIVHYNVDVNNNEWIKPVNENYSMAFVPGAFMEGETEKWIDFNNFVRLSNTNEIRESITFSDYILQGLKRHTKVDIIDDFTEISYLNYYCIPTEKKGVFCRNLALTRQVKGTLCYIEALYQDNFNESLLLDKGNNSTTNYLPHRVKEVSRGILEGIINYSHHKTDN